MKTYRKPHRVRKKKSIVKNRFFWPALLFLFFIGTIFYFLFFSTFFQFKKIIISGNEKISNQDIETEIIKKLEKKILFLSSKSIFLVNLNQIKDEILNNFPLIAKIEILRVFPDTLNVNIGERLAIANFYQEDNFFLLDEEGVIFEKKFNENLLKIMDKQNVESPFTLGDKVIEKDYLDKIFKIQKNLSEDPKIEIKEFIVFHERLNVKTIENWEIYFDQKGNLNWQLTKLNLVLKEKIPSEKRKDLEYIELRFGDFATFRYKEK